MASPEPPRNYHHPYEPYNIQLDFMNDLFDCLENGHVGIFESPTGTGKSLSLICGSLTWLRDYRSRQLAADLADDDQVSTEPTWVIEHERRRRRAAALQHKADLLARLSKVRAAEAKARQHSDSSEPPTKRHKGVQDLMKSHDTNEAQFLLEDYDSDQERPNRDQHKAGLSAKTISLLDKLNSSTATGDEEELGPDELKIFFCSRTHSQLAQFINELRSTDFAATPNRRQNQPSAEDSEALLNDAVKHLALGSRKNLCINAEVSALRSNQAINERCLELQKASRQTDSRCRYLPNRETQALVQDFRDHALAKVRDIEDLGRIGRKIEICPYYAARSAIRPSEIVTLPYPLLLQKAAREALNLSLKGHIVIIDEAHNLMDSISAINSLSVRRSQIEKARFQLMRYLEKFRNRLKGKNRVYVAQVVRLLDSLLTCLKSMSDRASSAGHVSSSELLSGKGVDQINLYKVAQYLRESKLAHKVDGYAEFSSEQERASTDKTTGGSTDVPRATTPILMCVQDFIQVLTYPDPEGRYFWHQDGGDGGAQDDIVLEYLLLDPTEQFKEVVSDARAVVLAGGTMSPMSDYTRHLFSYLEPQRLQTFSYGHVIPPSNLLAVSIPAGSSDIALEFTYEKRNSEAAFDELGKTILRFAGVVPDGLVVFFPSYAYLENTIHHWQKTRGSTSMWERLKSAKTIFQEGQAQASSQSLGPNTNRSAKAESLLMDYRNNIYDEANAKGALLFAVIGGSLSEGINFSDRLGRGVIVVGLPFPNAQSPAWKAKVEFVQQKAGPSATSRATAARELATNTCMRAVNQSIGRAIRHKNDYAAIMLLDCRYERPKIRSKLPGWIQKSLRPPGGQFTDHVAALKAFFEDKGGGSKKIEVQKS